MKRVALGIRMHSGWGVLVAVSGSANSVDLVDRRRIVVMDRAMPGAKQPYHFAASLELRDSKKYIANCAAVSEQLTSTAVAKMVRELDARHYRIVGIAVLLASGRPLPPLPKILSSHPLLHAAEGEFFRNVVRKAFERLKIPVTAIRERDLGEQAQSAFGNDVNRVQQKISSLGSSIGPPWTKDHKTAALAAAMILARL
jgi:hypothetical protein